MFYIQDPYFEENILHEELLEIINGASFGVGIYAFATKSGIDLVLGDSIFQGFIQNGGKFNLIVGIDEITNTSAIKTLIKYRDEYKGNLKVDVFLHKDKDSLFHPKFSYFQNEHREGALVLGSGNLTDKGLRLNREAFNINYLNPEKSNNVKEKIADWLRFNEERLKELEDREVLEKAELNRFIYIRNKKSFKTINDELSVKEEVESLLETWDFNEESEVLVAEIPKSGNRWKQANFNKDSFINFFGAKVGNNKQRILFRNVEQSGKLSEIESRPSVTVKSRNFRFELDAASGLDYPEESCPIGVFIKVATRAFIYILVMPNDRNYNDIISFLDEKEEKKQNMRRYRTYVGELYNRCPNLSFWKI